MVGDVSINVDTEHLKYNIQWTIKLHPLLLDLCWEISEFLRPDELSGWVL